MKHLKILALAAMACAAFMAFASSASATTLDTSGGVLTEGTELSSSLKAKSSAILEDFFGVVQDTCTTSAVVGKTGNTTGTSISGSISSLTFENCSKPTKVLKNGSLSITWTEGRNGTVTGEGSEVEVEISSGNKCVYGTGTGTKLGTMTGVANTTETASLEIKAEVALVKTIEGFCTNPTKWTATYTVTTPKGLTVSN